MDVFCVHNRGVTIHNLGISIYCHFCIMIQQYDTVKSELAEFYRSTELKNFFPKSQLSIGTK